MDNRPQSTVYRTGAVSDMTTQKIFLITVALSLLAHIVLLALAGFLGGSGGIDWGEEVFTVTLEKRPDKTVEGHGEKNESAGGRLDDIRSRVRGDAVDTVDLDNADTKYYPYLIHVKERIDRQWQYPGDAFSRGEVGITVVQFVIEQVGALVDCRVVASSGSASLDAESVRAVRSAAPFDPFSEEFGLVRLNIVAKFRYTLAE